MADEDEEGGFIVVHGDGYGNPSAGMKIFYVQGDTSGCDKPPVDFKTEVSFWPGLS